MNAIVLLISMLLLIGFASPARAGSNPEEILKSIVKIRAVIPGTAESAKTLGTEREGNGVVIDADGTILTVGYLVREAEQIEVIVQGKKTVKARLVGYDYPTGFGILKPDVTLGVSPIMLGKSSAVQTGDSILVAGYGGREDILVTRVISRQEFAGYWEYLLDDAIYTLPAVNNFSGMALINAEGKLVGIGSLFTQVLVPSWGLIGCNVAIPIDLLPPILDDLRTVGRPRKEQKPWLGINAEESRGRIFITKVTAGSPAEKAGVKPGDIVLSVDGKELGGLSDFYRKIWAIGNAGVQVPLTLLQGSKIRELKVQSIDRQQRSLPAAKKEITL